MKITNLFFHKIISRPGFLVGVGILLLDIFLLAAATVSRSFADWLRRYVFWTLSPFYSRVTALFPGSAGEWMLAAGAAAVLLFLLLLAILLVLSCCKVIIMRRKELPEKKRYKKIRAFCLGYFRFFGCLLLVVSLIMVLNCYVLYHCTGFVSMYHPSAAGDAEGERAKEYIGDRAGGDAFTKKDSYTVGDLIRLREYIIEQADALSVQMPRDEKGYLIAPESSVEDAAILAMQNMGRKYPMLQGYYPRPKKLRSSVFFSQQYMMGYYFPFSMEANYNTLMYISNVPPTLCHELGHLKGFIYEDEAGLIGYLACTNYGDDFFRYCGYLSVLGYLDSDLYRNLGRNTEAYLKYRQENPLVMWDNIFLTKEAWELVEKKSVLDTETVHKASNTFLETSLNLNGIEDGVASYGRVVGHLLEYYDGVLY